MGAKCYVSAAACPCNPNTLPAEPLACGQWAGSEDEPGSDSDSLEERIEGTDFQWLHNFLNCFGHKQGFELIAKVCCHHQTCPGKSQ